MVKVWGQNSNRNTIKQTVEMVKKKIGWRRRCRYYVTGARHQESEAAEWSWTYWIREGERLFWAHSHCDIMKGGTQGFSRHEVSDKQEVLFEDVSPSTAFSIRQRWRIENAVDGETSSNKTSCLSLTSCLGNPCVPPFMILDSTECNLLTAWPWDSMTWCALSQFSPKQTFFFYYYY